MTDANFLYYVVAFISTFILTIVAERILIPRLRRGAKQPIYEGGPQWHISKEGTPTMGGLAFLLGISIALLLSSLYLFLSGYTNEGISLISCLVYAVLNSSIGIIDDLRKLSKRENEGLTPKQKLLLQGVITAAFLWVRAALLGDSTALTFSFGYFDIGWLYYPMAFLILVGLTNFANLTDGIDGLASGVAFAVSVSLFYISCALCYEVCFISAAIMGATTGFLIFNIHPARIFMGDTGSLLLGSLLASAAVALGNPLVIICVGGVYVIEGASVILQVLFYKLTRRRLFKMAPIHHHLEQCGWSENRICIVAILATFIVAIPAFIVYLP